MFQRFVYGTKGHVPDYMILKNEIFRIISDNLGSVRLVVRLKDGSIAQEMMHDEFGRVLKNTAPGFQPFGYAGGLYDHNTNLVQFGARWYNPEIGRWISKDPIGFAGGDTNLYSYVSGDPMSYIDPTGLVCEYSQGTGRMRCTNTAGVEYYNEVGYAGTGFGRNNSDFQSIPSVGPLPQGTYTVGSTRNSPNTGRNTMTITPDLQTRRSINSMGRDPDSFRIHGNNSSNDASHGCIILPPNRTSIPVGETINVGP